MSLSYPKKKEHTGGNRINTSFDTKCKIPCPKSTEFCVFGGKRNQQEVWSPEI